MSREQMHNGIEPVQPVSSFKSSLAEAPSTKRTIRTLVAEPLPRMLKPLAQVLAQEGDLALVGTATDGCQALRYALALSPGLVVMDFHLPQLNGIQATRQLKQLENPPVIILMASEARMNSEAMTAGADAFVLKARDMRVQLRARLRELFGLGNGDRNPNGVCREDCIVPQPAG
jgi:CheY-like chemotaxis protein